MTHLTPAKVGAVVVNHDAGDALRSCVESLRAEGVGDIVVADNASTDGSVDRLEAADPLVRVLRTGANLGYGGGANRGLSALDVDLVLVCNPDVLAHAGSLEALRNALAEDSEAAIAGPCLLGADGNRYPSARRFPSWADAAGHTVLGVVRPDNRFSRRYRMSDLDLERTSRVDWVSGAIFLARRRVLDQLGGFDEGYFMYLEDTDLCWRATRAGYRVLYVPGALVSHQQGLSTAKHPYRMLVAHHRSALRFAARTTTGWRRAGLPAVALVLGLRLIAVVLCRAAGWRRLGSRHSD